MRPAAREPGAVPAVGLGGQAGIASALESPRHVILRTGRRIVDQGATSASDHYGLVADFGPPLS